MELPRRTHNGLIYLILVVAIAGGLTYFLHERSVAASLQLDATARLDVVIMGNCIVKLELETGGGWRRHAGLGEWISFEKLRSIYPETLDVRTEDSIGRRYYLVRDDWRARICRDGGECLGEVKLTRQDDPQADIPGAP